MTTLLDRIVTSLKEAAHYNQSSEVAPAAVFWPDKLHDWEGLMSLLREQMPVLTLGDYNINERSGPMEWIRCMMARTLEHDRIPAEAIPVLYLPGVSGWQIYDLGSEDEPLALLADLYYRSTIWRQPDWNDWTIADFLRELGVSIRRDPDTRRAMRRALPKLAGMTVAQLNEDAPWRARDFDALLGFPHPVAEPDIETLIAQGESATLEFKSTARWNVVDNKKDKTMEQVILKTVAGMLNSEQGGVLLIGVEDSGIICGLDPDYQTWKTPEQRNCDQYELWLTGDLLFRELGRQFSLFIKTSFHSVQGKDVCKVTVLPASMPAYLSEKREGRTIDVFYLRTGNQTILVDSMSEFAAYYQKRWGGIA